MKTAFLYLLLVLTLSSCRSCKRENYRPSALPPETDTGANAIGCMVDDRAYVPYVPLFYSTLSCDAYYNPDGTGTGRLTIQAQNTKDDLQLLIQVDSAVLRSDSLYVLGLGHAAAKMSRGFTDYVTYGPQALGGLYLRHWDSTTHVLSGRFWMDGIDPQGNRITVREGRFDFRLY